MNFRKGRWVFALAAVFAGQVGGGAYGDIFRWDNHARISTVVPGPGVDLGGASLSFGDFAHFDLTGGIFSGSDLSNARFMGANLSAANLYSANLTDVDFSGANFTGTALNFANFSGANLANAVIKQATFWGTSWDRTGDLTSGQFYSTASYKNHDLSGVRFYSCDLSGWNLASQNLSNAVFGESALIGTNLAGANLANVHAEHAMGVGAHFTGANLTGALFLGANFNGADFSGADLSGADFSQYITLSSQWFNMVATELANANFTGANLTNVRFSMAGIANCTFNGAIIKGAYFDYANVTAVQVYSTASYANRDMRGICWGNLDMSNWNLDGQDLSGAMFQGADLGGATFKGAVINGAALSATTHFTSGQLYTTASYANKDLSGVGLAGLDLSGWDFSDQDLTNTTFYSSNVSGADFTGAIIKGAYLDGWTSAQLYSTASYVGCDLSNIVLTGGNMAGWSFAGQNLTQASFNGSNLANADFSGASATQAVFESANLNHARFKQAVLTNASFIGGNYEFADFSQADLSGADFGSPWRIFIIMPNTTAWEIDNPGGAKYQMQASDSPLSLGHIVLPPTAANLAHADFADANLTRAKFNEVTLAGANFVGSILLEADFSGADLRGAIGWVPQVSSVVTNAIRPDGVIQGLNLGSGERLTVRNFSVPISVRSACTFDSSATLQFMLEDGWESQIHFDDGVAPVLAGTLVLEIAPDVDPLTLVGMTFSVFAWNEPLSEGNRFETIITDDRVTFDLSELYTAGRVTITSAAAVPEPATVGGLLVGVMVLAGRGRRRSGRNRSCRYRHSIFL